MGGRGARTRRLTRATRTTTTQAYLTRSPDFADVLMIWDGFHANHAQKVCAPLLATCACMLRVARDVEADGTAATTRERLALDSLARAIMTRRMRHIYSHLGSGIRVRVNAALMVLAAIAGRGKRSAAELFRTFDFSLAALPKIASPPREGASKDGVALKRRKEPKDVLAGSTRRAFCEFVLAFFSVKDRSLLRPLLAQRVLFGNVARFSAGDEVEMQYKILRVLSDDVLSKESGVPSRLRAALFGDVSLEQLATISGQSDDAEQLPGRVAIMATNLLVSLFTDPAHGLVSEKSGVASKKCATIVRLLHKLRPIENDAHHRILLIACETHPLLATLYLPGAKFTLEPRLSSHWLTSANLLGRISVAAGKDSASSEAAARIEGANAVGESEGATYIKAVIPPALAKHTLSKGLAHSSPVIRHGTLCLLLNVTRAIGARLSHLNNAIAEAKERGSERAWKLEELASYARLAATTFLPEVQSTMTAYTASKGAKEDTLDANAALLVRCHALNAVAAHISAVPEALMDAKVDLNKLLPSNDPTMLAPAELAAVINVLCAARGLGDGTIQDSMDRNGDEDDSKVSLISVQDSGVNQGHLLSVLRVVIFATAPEARSAARRLAKHYLVTSGALDGRAAEADVWIDKLTSFRADGFEHSREILLSCTEFLAEATTAATRRRFKHDSWIQQLLKDSIESRPERFGIAELTEDFTNNATIAVSALAQTACESIGKVLKSEKRSHAFKRAVSAYVASVMTFLIHTSFDPWILATCVCQAIGEEQDPAFPAMASLRAFTRHCVEETVELTVPSTRNSSMRKSGDLPTEWSSEYLVEAIKSLSTLSPEERGLALFSVHAHISSISLLSADTAAIVMFGSAENVGEDTALTMSLISSLSVCDIITCCSCGIQPLLGADMSKAWTAQQLCARAIAQCSKRDIIRSTRSLIFWCKWNHSRGDVKAVMRLLDLCRVALSRARAEGGTNPQKVRETLFAPSSLYTILDDSTDRTLSELVIFDAILNLHNRELYFPYVRRSVKRLHEVLNKPEKGCAEALNVSLISLASDEEKVGILEKIEQSGDLITGIKVAGAISSSESSASVRMRAVRFAVRTTLVDQVDASTVVEACRIAESAMEASFSHASADALSGTAPDLAAIPEALELIESVLEDADSEPRVRLAATFLAHSDGLALHFLIGMEAASPDAATLLKLLPMSAKAFRWESLYSMVPQSKDLAVMYRDLLVDKCYATDSLTVTLRDHVVDTLSSCMQIAPYDDFKLRARFVESALPSKGWMLQEHADHIVRARLAVELFVASEEVEEQIMLLISVLRTLAALTQSNDSVSLVSRDPSSEKYLAESLTRVLDQLSERNSDSFITISAHVMRALVEAAKAFVKRSIAHKFRAHRRLAVIGRLCSILSIIQTDQCEFQTLAENVLEHIAAHPLFARSLTDRAAFGDSALPQNINDMPTMVKSIVEAVSEPSSSQDELTELNNASSLKLELLRVIRSLWRLQHADGENTNGSCLKWRANQIRVIIILASGYGATLSETDRLLRELMLEIDASTGGGALKSIGYLWGESVTHYVKTAISIRQNEDANFDADDLLYSDPSPALLASAIREGSPPDARRAAATAARYPIARHLVPRFTEVEDDDYDDLVPFGYDPAWMLPFTLHALKTSAMDPREAVAWGLVPLAVTSLTSRDENMRRVAYAILSVMNDRINDPLTSFRERTQVLSCLNVIRNTTSSALMRWPSSSAALAAEGMLSSLYPESDTFMPLQKQMNRRAALDLSGLPLFLPMLNSGDVEAKQHRLWILRLLRASLKDDVDATIFRKTFAIEVIMSHYSATLAESFARFLMLDMVARACVVLPAARPLVEGGGLISWLASVTRAACVNDKHAIRSGDTPAVRAATAKIATEALLTLIRHKGSIYLGPTGTAADYLSALQTIRTSILREEDDTQSSNAAELAGRRAALGPYLKLHVEIATRLRRRIAEVGDPVEIAKLCHAVDAAKNASELRADMFNVIVTSEGGGLYAKKCTRETHRALADAVMFSASWAAAHAADVLTRVSVLAGKEAFEKTARWCASALANGGSTLANALLSTPECGGASRFVAIFAACERRASDRAKRELRLVSIAAHLCMLRAIETFDESSSSPLAASDASIKRTIESVKGDASTFDVLDGVVASGASGDSTAAAIANAFLRAIFAGVEPYALGALLEKIKHASASVCANATEHAAKRRRV